MGACNKEQALWLVPVVILTYYGQEEEDTGMTTDFGPKHQRLTHPKVLPTSPPWEELDWVLDSFLLACLRKYKISVTDIWQNQT